MITYPSVTNLVASLLTSNPSRRITGAVGISCMARGLVTATLSIKPAPNTKAFDEPQELDTAPPGYIDHHKLPVLPVSKLQIQQLTMIACNHNRKDNLRVIVC